MTKSFEDGTVFVVDDDARLADSLRALLMAGDFQVELFSSPQKFAESWTDRRAGCLLLDLRFPTSSGLDFQDELLAAAINLPVILMTGHADVPSSVRALKAGAIDFLVKPFDQRSLFDAVRVAFERGRERREREAQLAALNDRLATLTTREREVFGLVVSGLMNKHIAAELQVSEITVKVHRGRVMRKMGAANIPELVRMYARLGLPEDI